MTRTAFTAVGVFRLKSRVPELLAVALLAGPISANAALIGDLQQTAPASVNYVDTGVFSYSATGDVTASVMAVDLMLGIGNLSTSGCEAADFAGFAAGSIALIQRGLCSFQVKAENAAAAGAFGVLIFNQGNSNTADRLDLIVGTLDQSYIGGIPVMGLTYARGAEFASTPGLVVRMFVREVVPEPGTLALLGLGLLGLGMSRRRKA